MYGDGDYRFSDQMSTNPVRISPLIEGVEMTQADSIRFGLAAVKGSGRWTLRSNCWRAEKWSLSTAFSDLSGAGGWKGGKQTSFGEFNQGGWISIL